MYIFSVSSFAASFANTHPVPLCTKHHIPQRTCSMNGSSVLVLSFFSYISSSSSSSAQSERLYYHGRLSPACVCSTDTEKKNIKIPFFLAHLVKSLFFPGHVRASGSAVSSSAICPLNLYFCLLAQSPVMLRNKSKWGQTNFWKPFGKYFPSLIMLLMRIVV